MKKNTTKKANYNNKPKSNNYKKQKKSKGGALKTTLIVVLVVALLSGIGVGSYYGYQYYKDQQNPPAIEEDVTPPADTTPEDKPADKPVEKPEEKPAEKPVEPAKPVFHNAVLTNGAKVDKLYFNPDADLKNVNFNSLMTDHVTPLDVGERFSIRFIPVDYSDTADNFFKNWEVKNHDWGSLTVRETTDYLDNQEYDLMFAFTDITSRKNDYIEIFLYYVPTTDEVRFGINSPSISVNSECIDLSPFNLKIDAPTDELLQKIADANIFSTEPFWQVPGETVA